MSSILALWFLGMAILFSGGFFSKLGLSMLFCSLALWTYTMWLWARYPDKALLKHFADDGNGAINQGLLAKPSKAVLLLLFSLQISLLCLWLLGFTQNEYSMQVLVVVTAIGAFVGTIWSLRSPCGWWLQLALFGLLNVILLLGVSDLRIDILIFQRDAAAALLEGRNPYTLTYPNISEQGDASREYGPGISINKRLQFGYVYLPLTLIAVIPGHLLGDFRFSYVAAVLLSALFLFGWRLRGEKALLGALFLWSPLTILIHRGYTEYFVAATLCFVLYCCLRQARWLPLACGLFLASKQYAVLCLPLFWLLVPLWLQSKTSNSQEMQDDLTGAPREKLRGFLSFCLQALVIASVVSLPMALWNWDAFYYSSLKLQFLQPFRADSLSFLALAKYWGWDQPPQWFSFLLLTSATAFVLKTNASRCSSFFLSLAWVFFLFFSFSKQGMANYYYFVAVALTCAIVARINEERTASVHKNL